MTRVEISGPEHSKKTTLAVLIANYLETLGVDVVRQKADPEYPEKETAGSEGLAARVAGMQVFVSEMQTSR